MKQAKYTPKPKLSTYALTDDFIKFLDSVKTDARDYALVSAKERRCFNLVWRYASDIPNLISNDALLLNYKFFADRYEKTQTIPKLLLVDDIMVHGRGMAKLLYQLEKLIEEELDRRGFFNTAADRFWFSVRFARSIDIYIYARNRGTLFLEDRYFEQLRCWKKLFSGELRNLSMQLSDLLIRWEVANTSYVCSVRNELLSSYLSIASEQVDNNDISISSWKRVEWSSDFEPMVVYLRFFGKGRDISRVSSVRFFPTRSEKSSPHVTSFTIIGDLKKELFDRICNRTKTLMLENGAFKILPAILEENNHFLQKSKAQLISYILSVIDFFDFYEQVVPAFKRAEITNNLLYDFRKIARCFSANEGDGERIPYEFSKIAGSGSLREAIRTRIYPLLDEASPLFCTTEDSTTNSISQAEVNRIVQDQLYRIGLGAELSAAELCEAPHHFLPERFQESIKVNEEDINEGVLSFADFCSRLNHKDIFEGNEYFFIASYLEQMDHGLVGSRLLFTKHNNEEVIMPILKAGELATSIFPRKVSVFLPAFAAIEANAFRLGLSATDAIVKFASERTAEEMIKSGQFDSEYICKWKKDYPNADNPKALAELKTQKQILKLCRQTFRGWNFINLTKQHDENDAKYQEFLFDKAKKFLGFE